MTISRPPTPRSWGWSTKWFPGTSCCAETDRWATRLAAAPTKAIAAAKYLTNRSLESDRATALWDEAVAQELVVGTEDSKEGLKAFAERRSPVFRGW